MTEAKPFKVDWSEADVAHVLDRVRAYRFPQIPAGAGWALGCDADFLKRIVGYWTDAYDWRAAMAELNRYPQFTAAIDGFDIHFLHVVGEADGKRPLIITHGWPGSHYEFWSVIDKLAYPSKHGGKAEDAFDLVIPSLPGFGFSSKPDKPFGQRATARLFNTLMTEVLGYDTYLAQGGDWGSLVTGFLGLDHGAHARAIHLNMLGLRSATPPGDADRRQPGRARRLFPAAGHQAAVAGLGDGRQSGRPSGVDRRALPRLVGPAQ
jgi:pimeloyl-ACP methyl ester carboxylesterase